MTTPQIEALIFPGGTIGKRNTCRARLQKLYHHSFFWRGALPTVWTEGRKPLIYRIDRGAVPWLLSVLGIERDEFDWKPSERNVSGIGLNHLVKSNDVRVALTVGADPLGLRVKQWIDERNLRRNHAKEKVTITDAKDNEKLVSVIPDGYFALWNKKLKKTAHHFLEIDLSTETGLTKNLDYRDWTKKIKAYLKYLHSDYFKTRYKAPPARMLTVTTGERRLKNLLAKTEAVGGKKLFWFTTFDKITPETIYTKSVWQVASMDEPQKLVW